MVTKTKPDCRVEGCSLTSVVIKEALCEMHYRRWRKYGDPEARIYQVRDPICTIEGCNGEHEAKGYCGKHYRRWHKHGDPLVEIPRGKPALGCQVEGCEEPHNSRGYCQRHYNRWMRHGDPHVVGHGGPHSGPRISIQPVLDLIEARGGLAACLDDANVHNDKATGDRPREALTKLVRRAADRGEVTFDTADFIVIRLFGVHPFEVYGDDWWTKDIDEEMEVAA